MKGHLSALAYVDRENGSVSSVERFRTLCPHSRLSVLRELSGEARRVPPWMEGLPHRVSAIDLLECGRSRVSWSRAQCECWAYTSRYCWSSRWSAIAEGCATFVGASAARPRASP